MILRYFKILILIIFTWILTFSSTFSSDSECSVLAELDIYNPDGSVSRGVYRIDPDTLELKCVKAFSKREFHGLRNSPDCRFIACQSFNRKTYTNELFLVDLLTGEEFQVTRTPANQVTDKGSIISTPSKYGFSPDGEWLVIIYPNGIIFDSNRNSPPLVACEINSQESSVVFIRINQWIQSGDINSITRISGDDFPSFSPSGQRFVVPLRNADTSNYGLMIYEISGTTGSGNQSFSGYQLPFSNVVQSSFASDNHLYIVNGNEVIDYDIDNRCTANEIDLSKLRFAALGYYPPSLPITPGVSEGPVAMGGRYFAFLMSSDNPQPKTLTAEGGDDILIMENKFNSNPILVFGSFESPWLREIKIPFSFYQPENDDGLVSRIYILPQNYGRYAVIDYWGQDYHAFRIVDMLKGDVSEPITGFFAALDSKSRNVIYTSCEPGKEFYKGIFDFTWEITKRNGKDTAIRINQLRLHNIQTGEDKALLNKKCLVKSSLFME